MNIREIASKITAMADKILEMLDLIEKGFMENKTGYLSVAMKKENEINELEKSLTGSILDSAKASKNGQDKKELMALQGAIEMLERMGDEAASLIERIEIKVAENLLFSDMGVAQFKETYETMKKSVDMMRRFLDGRDSKLRERIIDNGFHVKELVERYRKEHSDRLIQGVCTPMAANMYFDMLDFTGNLARHSSNIVKLF